MVEKTDNPFVGPRPIEKGEPFFGREREVRELADLLVAERIVLLHSPSGAGKSSLIEAALKPALVGRHFEALPSVRVGWALAGVVGPSNRYVRSSLVSLRPEMKDTTSWTAEESLPEYVERKLEELTEREQAKL